MPPPTPVAPPACAASRPLRQLALRLSQLVESVAPQTDLFGVLYSQTIGLHYSAGVREGLARYAAEGR